MGSVCCMYICYLHVGFSFGAFTFGAFVHFRVSRRYYMRIFLYEQLQDITSSVG